MKVVIDTNIFVSSFFGGNPRKVIDLWKNGKITLCLSKDILNEYVEVLERLGISHDEIMQLTKLFNEAPNVIYTSITPKISIVKKDPDDDKFIECAVELGAKYIITGDKGLLEIGKYSNIQILNPKGFLELL
ncbi:MAG: putative toxin-antitoxin system toxin component, PIN family [bacterium]